jgi:hypothetical protein
VKLKLKKVPEKSGGWGWAPSIGPSSKEKASWKHQQSLSNLPKEHRESISSCAMFAKMTRSHGSRLSDFGCRVDDAPCT